MIAQTQHGLTKQKTSFANIEIKDNRYDIYYGSKFPYDKFKKFMKDENTESLLLLHGPPGGGKSNLLKNLIMEAEEDVIYVPPSMVSVISSPGFISFMLQNKKNFLIIEDAEEILSVDRNSGTNNLLSICDGFLKDALQMKVICTFNCDLKKIDAALLRKGRLYFEYKVSSLSIEEGQRLADFCDISVKIDKEMTLSEIFNHRKNTSVENSFEERTIGFL
jgi:SpoVK/Ycf46/Vps4 family AAA+-type ATPase